jgi:LPS export ABC transporter protein LptC
LLTFEDIGKNKEMSRNKTKRKSPAGWNILLVIFFTVPFIFMGCENDLEVIKTITKTSNFPTLTRHTTEIVYTDSARMKVRIQTPKLERYSNTPEPYIEFPEGIHVEFFNDSSVLQSIITSKYARYDERKQLWIAQNDVVARNVQKGEQLNTEELFWDENKMTIYSDKFSRVATQNGVFFGEEGFLANQNFTWYKLKGIRKSVVNVKDEEK